MSSEHGVIVSPVRRLRLTSPLTHGADVSALQRSINNRRAARDLPPIDVDGQYGPATAAAMRDTAFMLGLLTSSIDKGATPGIQRIIAHPSLRTPAQKARAASRKKRLGSGPQAALAWARTQIGQKEHPANSNTSPVIAVWQKACGMGPGPWCGAFAIAVALRGGAHITADTKYTPSIRGHAQAQTGGYRGWLTSSAFESARPGDHVVFDWNPGTGADHVGTLVSIDLVNKTVTCIEGNTSSSNAGSQDNGGTVAERTRPWSMVQGIAQVRWP
jgi:peptidoglycan hydrolase-like protein with peptidoglycan-binding domain